MGILAAAQNGETCVICEERKVIGIHINSAFICMECEQCIIATDTSDPQYKTFVTKMKKINHIEIKSY